MQSNTKYSEEANINKQLRVNDRIRVREVRLIDENSQQLGVVPIREALDKARDAGLDLIEVSPNANPPVCRIIDYGKFKYEQAKKDREASKRASHTELAMIRLRPNIDSHDLEVKLKNTRRHIEEGDKVRVFVMFRSRELSHPEIGRKLLEKMVEDLLDIAIIEKSIGMEGRQMSIMVAPKPKVLPVKPPKPPKEKSEKVNKPAPEPAIAE